MPQCKLCGCEDQTFPKSHIIPKFMYKNIKNEKSQIFRIRMPDGKRLRPIFDGIYEKPLLCELCEKKISKWESYAEKVLYGSTHINVPTAKPVPGTSYQEVSGIDYRTFKLFLLSILWRANVSSNNFFNEVDLGNRHSEVIQEMLLNEDAGEEEKYPIVMIIPKGSIGSSVGVLQPYKSRGRNNVTRYIFPICEAIYVYHVSSHGIGELEQTACLKKNDSMHIVYSPKPRIEMLMDLYNVKALVRPKIRHRLFNR